MLSASIVINRSPEDLYDMISDVTRMGEWSPACKACWWDEGASPEVGAWFTGRNEMPGRDPWQTRSQVIVATPGKEFAFKVDGTSVRWGYTFTAGTGGTEVTESWEVLPEGVEVFRERFGDDLASQLDLRADAARAGMAATLEALKLAAESA